MLLPQQAGGGAGDHATGPLAQAGHWRCPGSAPDMASRPRRPQGHPQGSCQKCGDQRGDGVPCGPSNEEGGHHGAQNQRANDSAASGTRLGEAVPMRRGGAGRGLRVVLSPGWRGPRGRRSNAEGATSPGGLSCGAPGAPSGGTRNREEAAQGYRNATGSGGDSARNTGHCSRTAPGATALPPGANKKRTG